MRLASDGETVMSNGDMEYLGGEGERQQGQVTKQSADVGVAEVHICMRRTDRLHCHQHTEQHGMSGGEAGNGLVDGLRGGLKVIEQPQTISLRLVRVIRDSVRCIGRRREGEVINRHARKHTG